MLVSVSIPSLSSFLDRKRYPESSHVLKKKKKELILWNAISIANALNYINSIRWDDIFNVNNSPHNAWCIFQNIVKFCVDNFAHHIFISTGERYYPPPSSTLRRLFSLKAAIWRLKKKSSENNVNLVNRYKAVSLRINTILLQNRKATEAKIIGDGNTKKFYTFINNKLQAKPKIMSLMNSEGSLTTDPDLMADLFNRSFGSVYTHDNLTMPKFFGRSIMVDKLSSVLFSPSSIFSRLSILKPSKTISPDGLSAYTLKILSPGLSKPLASLFEFLFARNYIPLCWKTSYIKPLFKKGSRTNPLNYRPIACTSICCRVMERVIYDQMFEFINDIRILSPSQHGFHRGGSTVTNLLESCTEWIFNIDNNYNLDAIYIDLSRAFDSVVYSKLIFKLKCVGISGDLLLWLESFLTGRKQCTVLEDSSSTFINVLSGVPQGSVLGPLLFLIFVNDLPDFVSFHHPHFRSSLKLFADDVKIYQIVNTIEEALRLQYSLNIILDWCNVWQLSINLGKCQLLHLGKNNKRFCYGFEGNILPSVLKVNDLGLLIDENLHFTTHIAAVAAKARGRCGVFLKSFISRDRDLMLKFYLVYVRPILEYASVVWNPTSVGDINVLESVQRGFTNKIPGCTFLPYSRRLEILGINSLQHRRSVSDLVCLYSIIVGDLDLSLAPFLLFNSPSVTRGHNLKIVPPLLKRAYSKQNFLSRTVPLWNTLPLSALQARSRASFRKFISNYLSDPFRLK